MVEHIFGGSWTEIKLARLAKYLTAYRTIFTGNEKARHFKTWYVDAFAGTGSRSDPDAPTELQLHFCALTPFVSGPQRRTQL